MGLLNMARQFVQEGAQAFNQGVQLAQAARACEGLLDKPLEEVVHELEQKIQESSDEVWQTRKSGHLLFVTTISNQDSRMRAIEIYGLMLMVEEHYHDGASPYFVTYGRPL